MYSPLRTIPRVAAAVALSFGSIYAIAQMPPVADGSASSKSPDNTGVNVRDRTNAAMTPFDQPNNAADIKTAAAVRHSIAADNSLSTLAHNVKLVASAGVVTLRGPVENEAEKAKVEELAFAASGVSIVHNELDIKH
jgi:hypothetical protein